MYWATDARPIPLEELGRMNTMYLGAVPPARDPLMVWGTTVDTDALDEFLKAQRQSTGVMFSPAHALVRAVAVSLIRHPKVNCRVIGRRVYRYDGVNIVMPMMQTRSGEIEIIFLHRVDLLSLSEIAQRFWSEARDRAKRAAATTRNQMHHGGFKKALARLRRHLSLRWVHGMAWFGFAVANRWRIPTLFPFQQELNGAHAFVNYLGFPGAPPLIALKPSSLPMNSFSVSVTMGPAEPRPVVVEGAIVIRNQAPLFVRTDHRMVNAFEAAAFINTLRSHLNDPASLLERERADIERAA
jgi:hypothetical protein